MFVFVWFLVSYCPLVPDVSNLHYSQEAETFHSLRSPNSYFISLWRGWNFIFKTYFMMHILWWFIGFLGIGFLVGWCFLKENSSHVNIAQCYLFRSFKISLLNSDLIGAWKVEYFGQSLWGIFFHMYCIWVKHCIFRPRLLYCPF